MKKQRVVVAVSGGIDSVVLLDVLTRAGEYELIVAHFDHGIRNDSADDARFVRGLAAHYFLPFVVKREELGAAASEEIARTRRYAFLREEADRHQAVIATAHHADDAIETIAINILRGTGWRGVAVLDTPGIVRPLLDMTKNDIREYALAHQLEWVEDSTNQSDIYLRNRIRHSIPKRLSDDKKQKLLDIWKRQLQLKRAIDSEVKRFIRADGEYERYLFINSDQKVAIELLRMAVIVKTATSPTHPQLERALIAIKTARIGAKHEIGDGVRLRFSRRTFLVETP